METFPATVLVRLSQRTSVVINQEAKLISTKTYAVFTLGIFTAVKEFTYLGKFLVIFGQYLSKCGKRQRKFNHGKSDNDAVIWLGLAR